MPNHRETFPVRGNTCTAKTQFATARQRGMSAAIRECVAGCRDPDRHDTASLMGVQDGRVIVRNAVHPRADRAFLEGAGIGPAHHV